MGLLVIFCFFGNGKLSTTYHSDFTLTTGGTTSVASSPTQLSNPSMKTGRCARHSDMGSSSGRISGGNLRPSARITRTKLGTFGLPFSLRRPSTLSWGPP